MTETDILSPLVPAIREDANVDFYHSSFRPIPSWPCSTADVSGTQLADELQHALAASGYSPLRHVGVDHNNGRVVLRGRVPTYFLKQLAQSIAASFPGVQVVDNNIEVACPR